MIGVIERRLAENNSHATQVSRFGYVELGGLGSRVNHSCDPNCGVRLNSSAAYDLIVRRAIEFGGRDYFRLCDAQLLDRTLPQPLPVRDKNMSRLGDRLERSPRGTKGSLRGSRRSVSARDRSKGTVIRAKTGSTNTMLTPPATGVPDARSRWDVSRGTDNGSASHRCSPSAPVRPRAEAPRPRSTA
ncbi:MAG: hypothetical protein ACRDZ4_22875 [Egibacteraceae bacterium]